MILFLCSDAVSWARGWFVDGNDLTCLTAAVIISYHPYILVPAYPDSLRKWQLNVSSLSLYCTERLNSLTVVTF